MSELGAETWFAGLRRDQAATRAHIAPIEHKRGRYKVHPLFDWTDRDIGRYLEEHRLPYHPLWDKGYLSIGDWHTTRSRRGGGQRRGAALLRFEARVRIAREPESPGEQQPLG